MNWRVLLPACAIGAGIGIAVAPALAHDPGMEFIPLCSCWNDGRDVVCEGGWPNGGTAKRAKVEVVRYDGKTVLSARLDDKGRLRFQRPAGAFVVLLSDIRGNGQTAEVDWRDIAVTRPRAR